MSGMQFILTPAGRAEMIAADNTGTAKVTISHIGVSASPDGLVGGQLAGEIKRLTTFAGSAVADDTIHVTIRDDSPDVYSLRAFALYSSTGTLLGWYAQAGVILEKAAQAMLLLAADIQFTQANATVLQFNETNWTNPPATTTVQGILRLATNAAAIQGVESITAVPPSALKAALDARLGEGAPSNFVKGLLTAATAIALRTALAIKGAALKDEGHGNGLDADLLDGQHGAYYRDFENLLNVPASFPPSAHDHPWAQISGAPSTAIRWPTFDEVTGKPAAYPPAGHGHAAGDISSGVFHVDRIPELAQNKVSGLIASLAARAALNADVTFLSVTATNSISGQLHHRYGYFNIGSYSATYGVGLMRSHYAANETTWHLAALDEDGVVKPLSIKMNGNQVWHQGTLPADIIGLLGTITAPDFNAVDDRTRFFRGINTSANRPADYSACVSLPYDTNGFGQVAVRVGSGDGLYFRRKTNGVIQPWREVWHDANFTPANIPTQSGDLLVSKSNAIIGVGIDGTRNGGIANFASAGSGNIALYSEYANGVVRLRPNGRTSATGELVVTVTGATLGGQGVVTTTDFAASIGSNGWRKLPDGTIEQWGVIISARTNEGVGPTITFPIAFPNACLNVQASDINPGADNWHDAKVQVVQDSLTKTQFRTYVQGAGNGTDNWRGMYWRAIGH